MEAQTTGRSDRSPSLRPGSATKATKSPSAGATRVHQADVTGGVPAQGPATGDEMSRQKRQREQLATACLMLVHADSVKEADGEKLFVVTTPLSGLLNPSEIQQRGLANAAMRELYSKCACEGACLPRKLFVLVSSKRALSDEWIEGTGCPIAYFRSTWVASIAGRDRCLVVALGDEVELASEDPIKDLMAQIEMNKLAVDPIAKFGVQTRVTLKPPQKAEAKISSQSSESLAQGAMQDTSPTPTTPPLLVSVKNPRAECGVLTQFTLQRLLANQASSETPTSPTKLVNVGDSCYLNSVLQAICPGLQDRISSIDDLPEGQQELKRGQALAHMLKAILRCKKPSKALLEEFRNTVWKFKGPPSREENEGNIDRTGQQDASEFFHYLASSLEEDSEQEFLVDAWASRHKVQHTCKKCSHQWYLTTGPEKSFSIPLFPFVILKIPDLIETSAKGGQGSAGVTSGLQALDFRNLVEEALFAVEEREGHNCVNADNDVHKCSSTRVDIQSTQFQFAEIMIFSISRFYRELHTVNRREVTVPDSLELNNVKYSLQAVVLHEGPSLESGHYTAKAKWNNEWHDCNDYVIKKTKPPADDKALFTKAVLVVFNREK